MASVVIVRKDRQVTDQVSPLQSHLAGSLLTSTVSLASDPSKIVCYIPPMVQPSVPVAGLRVHSRSYNLVLPPDKGSGNDGDHLNEIVGYIGGLAWTRRHGFEIHTTWRVEAHSHKRKYLLIAQTCGFF